MSILSSIAKSIGVDTLLPVVEEIAIEQLVGKGHDAAVHAFTVPSSVVDQIVAKTGADPAKVHAAVAAFAVAGADLVVSFASVPKV